MADQVIGSCSLCGGDVVGHVGAWYGVIPPPPAVCTQCGAREARQPVIPMRPAYPIKNPLTLYGFMPHTICKENTDG